MATTTTAHKQLGFDETNDILDEIEKKVPRPVPVQEMDMDCPDESETETLPIKVYLDDKLVELNADQMLQIMEFIRTRPKNTSQKKLKITSMTKARIEYNLNMFWMFIILSYIQYLATQKLQK
eukprot:728351_1